MKTLHYMLAVGYTILGVLCLLFVAKGVKDAIALGFCSLINALLYIGTTEKK